MRSGVLLRIERPGVKVRTRASIPLDRAMCCLDCDSIFEAEGTQACPSCGSAHAISLGRALNRDAKGCA